MKRKALSIILCTVWILICFLLVFVPKEYMSSLPDEISVENHPASGSIIEFRSDSRVKAYRENGKYFLSYEGLIYNTEPKIYELTKSEYRYCTRVDTYRLENQITGGVYDYSICVKRGNKEENYNDNFWISPLYEMQRIKDIKRDSFDQEDASYKKIEQLERFLDEGKFDMAFLFHPTYSYNINGRYYYKNAWCKDYYDKWSDLCAEYRYEQDLNVFLLKKYDKGQVELRDINLKDSLEKKEELYERITGNTINRPGGGNGYNYKNLLSLDGKSLSNESKQTILDQTIIKLDGYDHAAYEYIAYGDDNYCIYELYLPDEEETYELTVKKPFLMPKWYLKWAVNTVMLNDRIIVSPGLIYNIVLFVMLTVPICILIGLFGGRRK